MRRDKKDEENSGGVIASQSKPEVFADVRAWTSRPESPKSLPGSSEGFY
jgi:hypothetical protein